MTSISRKFLLGAGLLALSATAAAAVPALVRSDLNLRSGPGTEYGIVGSMPAGATVDVGSCTGRWCVVAYGGEQGYAARSYLDMGAAALPGGPVYGPSYGYVAPDDYYGDDYYYGSYGPGVTFGFGYSGRDRHYGRYWRHGHRDRDRGLANRGNNRPVRLGTAPPADNPITVQPRRGDGLVGRGQDFRSGPSFSGRQGGSFSRRDTGVSGNPTGVRGSVGATVGAGGGGSSGGGAATVGDRPQRLQR